MTPPEAPIYEQTSLGATLGQINQAIIRAQSRPELFSKVCRLLVDSGHFNMAWIDWLDTASNRLLPAAKAGAAAEESAAHCGRMVMQSGQPCGFNEPSIAPCPAGCSRVAGSPAPGACAAYPVRLQNQLCAVLTAGALGPCAWNGAEAAFLEDVALNLSFALDKFAAEHHRREVEDALNEGQQLLQSVLQSGLDGFYLVDPRGRFLQVNDAYCAMSGYSREELLSMCVADVEASESAQDVAAHIQNIISRGMDRFESRHRRKDGQIIDIETSVSFQNYEGGRFFSFLRNVTDHKRAEQALRESEERYRRLFASNPHPMWVFDVESLAFLEVNDAAVVHYGYTRQEFLSMTLEELRSPEDVPALLKVISSTKTGYSFNCCARHRKKDGTNIYVEISDYRFLQDGKLVSLILANDITERRKAEEAVRRSEAELRSFVENSPFGIFRSHIEEDRFLDVNPALVKMLGYASAEEVLSLKLSTDVYLDLLEREKTLTPLLRDGFNRTEVQWRRKDGEFVTLHLSGRIARDSIHGGQAFEGIASDMTERRQAERALRQSEEHFRSLFENMAEGYAHCKMLFDDLGRPEDFIYLDVNNAFATLTGLSGVIGRKVTEIIPGFRELQPEMLEIYGRVALTGRPERFEAELKPLSMWFAISVYSPEKKHFVAVFDVITERKRAELELRESEERFRQVVESSPMGILIQTEGIHRYFNPSALAMLGAESASQVVGRGFLEVMHPDSRASVIERARVVREEKKTVPFAEERLLRMDGTASDAEITAVPFIFEGRDGALVFLRDINERKREEEKRRTLEQQLRQAQKMEAVGRLAGGIAHDFNNLLMVIQSYTEMLQDGLPAGDILRQDAEQVLKAARRATSLTGQMLAFSRKQIINPVLLDLNAVIGETAAMLKRMIGEDIEFRLSLAGSWTVEADSDQIVQVLMNLCVNSRDAMPEGGTLSIATENVTMGPGRIAACPHIAPGEYLKFSVADTGTGIGKQAQEQIFEPFFTTKEVGKGTGLGLAMVYGIVKQNGGYLWVESEPGHGACFTICLPRATGAISSVISAKTDVQPRGSETLLVAEDEEALRVVICGYLRSLGYTVLEAISGQHALAASGQHAGHIDLLITDVVMPKMSGREISQMLGSQRSGLKTIFMSGYTDDAVLRHGIHKLGATFLQKPFSLGTLARKVRDTLENKTGN
jgi:PAS domain S-box-containing protein